MTGYTPEMLGATPDFASEFGFEFSGAILGGMGSMGVNAAAGEDIDPLQSFSRGAGAVISSKFDEKAFKKGLQGVEEFKPYKFANGSIWSGIGAMANGYGEYGDAYTQAYGGRIGGKWGLVVCWVEPLRAVWMDGV